MEISERITGLLIDWRRNPDIVSNDLFKLEWAATRLVRFLTGNGQKWGLETTTK